MVIEIPGIETDKGLKLCDGNFEMYLRFLRLYISKMPAVLNNMRNVTEQLLKDYTINAHGVKGMSETIGAEETRKTAKQLEEMAKEGNLTGVLSQNNDFIKHTENLIAGITSWLEKHDTSKT